MNKNELIKRVATETGFTQVDVGRVIDTTLDAMKFEILTEGRINLHGFGTFSVVTRAPRTIHSRLMGRGQVAEKAVSKTIPERRVVKFKPAKQLKAVVAGV